MGSSSSRSLKSTYSEADLPEHLRITTVNTGKPIDQDLDPLLVQLYNCPQFSSTVLTATETKYVIDSRSLAALLAEYQKVISLSSKAIALEQHSLSHKIKQADQLTAKLLAHLNHQIHATREIEARLSEVQRLQKSLDKTRKTLDSIMSQIETLEQLLPPQQGPLR